MVDIVSFSTKSDRELLVVLASSFNTLTTQTTKLCDDVAYLQRIANANKDKLQDHDTKLIAVVKANADITEKTADMLRAMYTLLDKHTEQLTNLEFVRRFFWWGIGVIGAGVGAIPVYIFNKWLNP